MTTSGGSDDRWIEWRTRVETTLKLHLTSPAQEECGHDFLLESMRYACLGGGKRLRAIIVYAFCDFFQGNPEQADTAAAAIEMVHAYSLVHDDLPAMDDDDLRRGRPSCHKAFNEATAILAGDALQSLAHQIIAEDARMDADRRVQVLAILSRAIGYEGMAGGQSFDIASENQTLNVKQLETLHAKKTGALISASAEIGALAAGPRSPLALENVRDFARRVGVAFQIIDDVLDDEADPAVLGKSIGKDRAVGKSTYVTLLGSNVAKERAITLKNEALARLERMGDNTDELERVVDFVVNRSF